ncbi:CMGC/RCK/MAK protein kinase [Flagelloscypha sp. PMI_526]|nr:CMGC/RCK/MAK protein kinase [Flagelloscypha sp. PMI_526]
MDPSSPNRSPMRQDIEGVPAVSIQDNRLVVGSAESTSLRSYTPIKQLGDGSFGTVWLCDWHGTLPPNTPLSPMQCGEGARPDWVGKRLVAVKRMKKRWEGGWNQCQHLKELESLRAIPFHPNIIPLYDFFLMPSSKELYFVFESMEGNLFHLIKTRKGRPLAGGLVSSIFRQIVSGLDHIHSSGYFHRDMKPENVLVTTTGLFDYTSLSPLAPANAPKEKDVICIIKLADFGLARETSSRPPYTDYVSTRWYRAPEVLLLSRDYSNPVDMWALGTIMAELVNLRPLFPGANQLDQITRICQVLGDPSDAYGLDSHQASLGGGAWPQGVRLGEKVGYSFPQTRPKDIHGLFGREVPVSLVHCIRDLLRYDPARRLTSRQCMQHPYLMETTRHNNIPFPKGIRLAPLPGVPMPVTSPTPRITIHNANSTPNTLASVSSRSIPPSHSHHTPPRSDGKPSHRAGVYTPEAHHFSNGKDPRTYQHGEPDAMDVSPQDFSNGHLPQSTSQDQISSEPSHPQGHKLLSFKRPKWLGGSNSQSLARVEETPVRPPKRPPSTSSDEMSIIEPIEQPPDPKKIKKAAEKLQREAEMQKRKLALESQREQARAVIHKRNMLVQNKTVEFEFLKDHSSKRQVPATSAGSRRDRSRGREPPVPSWANPALHRQPPPLDAMDTDEWRGISERALKARRLEWDEDSASSDVHSVGRASSISFASVDSDPGPSRVRNRPNLFSMPRMQSSSSLRTSVDEFPPSARSSNSFSLESQLAHDFRVRATMEPHPSPLGHDQRSPSLSPILPPPAAPPWISGQQNGHERLPARREAAPGSPFSTLDHGFDFNPKLQHHPPSPNFHVTKSAINPIFKVVCLPHTTLPSFAYPNIFHSRRSCSKTTK